jgi:ABC-type branched-subunit amino acid transport system substrate-binding protein
VIQKRRWVLAVATVAALTAAACGSSSKKASSTATTKASGTSATTAATGSAASSSSGGDIVIEGLAQLTFYPGIDSGFDARITRFNNQGGLNGRKIKFLGVQDTGTDPAKAQSEAQSIVLKDHVFAVAPIASEVALAPTTDFFDQNHIPWFGWAVSPNWCNDNWAFGVNGCLEPTGGGSLVLETPLTKAVNKPASQLRVAIINEDNPGATASETVEGNGFKTAGFPVVYNQAPVPVGGATDYTPYVQALLASKPDVVFESLDFGATVGLNAAMKAAGFKGILYSPGVTYAPSVLSSQANVATALDGEYDNVQFAVQEMTGNAAVQKINSDLQAIGKPAGVTLGVAIGYWSADQFITLLQAAAAKGGDLTPDSFDQAANAGAAWSPSPAGGTCPEKWPDAHKAGTVGGVMLQINGNKFVEKTSFDCYSYVPFTS